MKIRQIDPSASGLAAPAVELALLGEISLLLDADRLFDGLDRALERLGRELVADVCELFLADAAARELFLVAHTGPDADAFSQRIRFASREGFPGIVLHTGALLSTSALDTEADFLRTRVTKLGYRAALATPLMRSNGAVFGCLLIAWKAAPADLERSERVALLASRALAGSVWSARTQARLEGTHALHRSPSFAEHLRTRVGADGAEVILDTSAEGWTGLVPMGLRGSGSKQVPSALPEHCPARVCACVQVLGGREGWPRECLEAGCATRARYCVPLIVGDRFLGVATSAFHGRIPAPLSRTLPLTFWLTEDLGATGETGDAPLPHSTTGQTGARLVIRCLGHLQISLDGRPIGHSELRREKARELLALLVIANGRPVAWQQLAAKLWPEASAAAARNRFQVTLAALRSALEPGDAVRWTFIRRDGQRYLLDPDAPLLVDAWRFHQLVSSAHEHRSPIPLLEEAAALYEGEPFGGDFAGTGHDEFAARCRETMVAILGRLAEHHCERGDPAGALAVLRRAEAVTPLREDIQRALMTALVAAGRTGEALSCYERLRATLLADYGARPSPESTRLYQQIRAHD
jgi:DNA-binding SARP family transcriptional activator